MFPCKAFSNVSGERGIRTPGPVTRTTVFKTAALDHSAISPSAKVIFSSHLKKSNEFFLRVNVDHWLINLMHVKN